MIRHVRHLSLVALATLACPKTPDPAPRRPFEVSARAKSAGAAAITVAAKDGFHVNAEYPVAFTPSAESTVTFTSKRLPLGDGVRTPCAPPHQGDACQAEYEVPFTAGAEGPQTFDGTLAFSVCSPENCLIEKVPVRLALTTPGGPTP